MQKFLLTYFVFGWLVLQAQNKDTVKVLDEVVIHAFAQDKPPLQVSSSIAKLSTSELERFGNTNLLPVLNTQPGVRMEERSPGSYRLSIRGSTIRSPFGVRNVKVYWNGLPLTDNGGNTYLNLLDFNSVDNLEIIKGPGSSLYGAGTGGVLLLNKTARNKNELKASLQGGSYGLYRFQAGYAQSFKNFNLGINQSWQQSDGYRENSSMKRYATTVHGDWLLRRSTLSFNLLYSDLYYQTPGGLTKIQYDTLPSMARPTAVDKKAAVYNKTYFGGLTYSADFGKWDVNASLFGNATDFKNPTFRNYEKRDEKSWGIRTENHWKNKNGQLTIGGEMQIGRSKISTGNNNQGNYVDVGNDVRLPVNTYFLFAQYDLTLPLGFNLTGGLSMNALSLKFDTLLANKKYDNLNSRTLNSIVTPRLAALKKWGNHLSTYASYSRGYSPPSTAEVYPSISVYNATLKPEYGNNYEVGFKGQWSLLEFSLVGYSLQLNQTIIRQNAGADYYINAGRSAQNGIELLIKFKTKIGLSGWHSASYNHYRFLDYKQDNNTGSVDYSGNKVTGTASSVLSTGLEYRWRGVYINITRNYVGKIPLNDANTAYASEYYLLGSRLGYRTKGGNGPFEFFGGGDNLLDRKYSLGNDFNAVGARYYNAAPRRNFYLGLQYRLPLKKA